MFRHPHYLEVPWDIHGHPGTTGPHRHLWWLIALLVLLGHVSDRRGSHLGNSVREQCRGWELVEADA